MLPTFRILPPGTASVPPAPTVHAGLAAVLAAVMAAAMALAAVAAVSVGGQASIARHGAVTLRAAHYSVAVAATRHAGQRAVGRTLRFRIVR